MNIGKSHLVIGKCNNIDNMLDLVNSNAFFTRKSMREIIAYNQRNTRIEVGLYNILYNTEGFMNKELFNKLYNLVYNSILKVEQHYGYEYSRLRSLVLVKLNANSCIDEHIDEGGIYEFAHRIHIPIVTNDNCIFQGEDEVYSMKQGDIVEINNCIRHSVTNSGSDRVHLIFDLVGIKKRYDVSIEENEIPNEFYIKE